MASETVLLARLEECVAREASPKTGRLHSERSLAHSLGVGRTELRKALGALEGQGRIKRHVGKGTFLTAMRETADEIAGRITLKTSPAAAMEARLLIEPELVSLAAEKATPEQIIELRRLCAEIRAVESWDAYAELDWRFHNMLAAATGNILLTEIQQLLNQVRRTVVWGDLDTPPPRPRPDYHSFAEHEAIVAAIASRDPRAAAAAMRRHLEATRERLLNKQWA
jgi:DNA-binding FadR family transcriptional regulator